MASTSRRLRQTDRHHLVGGSDNLGGAPGAKNILEYLLLEPVCVDLDVLVPLGGQVILWKDRLHWTLVNTQTAIDARLRIYVELLNFLIAITLLRWVDAINGTDFNTRGIFCPDTWFSNDVRHSRKILANSGKNWSKTHRKPAQGRLPVQNILSVRLTGSS